MEIVPVGPALLVPLDAIEDSLGQAWIGSVLGGARDGVDGNCARNSEEDDEEAGLEA